MLGNTDAVPFLGWGPGRLLCFPPTAAVQRICGFSRSLVLSFSFPFVKSFSKHTPSIQA